jgi:hypothetical protein
LPATTKKFIKTDFTELVRAWHGVKQEKSRISGGNITINPAFCIAAASSE